jgi:hypothetical protein
MTYRSARPEALNDQMIEDFALPGAENIDINQRTSE